MRVAIRKPYIAPPTPALGEYPAQVLVASDVPADSLYWTRPYLNPDAVGGGDEYLWLGSTDHASSNSGRIYRGFSASPATVPASWTAFVPAGGSVSTQNETPSFVYKTGHARPYWLYWHPNTSDSGGGQNSRLTTHTGVAWESGTDEGEVFPANADSPELDHTGYANVYRLDATDWRAWTFARSFADHGRAEYAFWISSDGLDWTVINDDLDVRSMVTEGDMLVVRAFNRFEYNGTVYCITTQHPDDVSTGGSNADPGGEVVLCSLTGNQTFVFLQRLWGPLDDALTDDLRDVRAYQDDSDPALIHLYIHNTRTAMLYATLEMAGGA